jgi:hypothetical protein
MEIVDIHWFLGDSVSDYKNTIIWNGNNVSWYFSGTANILKPFQQLNDSKTTYYYTAIG